MTLRPTFQAQAIGLSLLLAAPPALQAADEKPRPARPPTRVYTNEDLERVHPFAAQTGGSSVPAAATDDAGPARPSEPRHGGKDEAHWRAEAAQMREQLRAL